MTDCPYQPVAHNWWLCPDCGDVRYGEKPPRRNCPAAPDAPTPTVRVLADVLATDGLVRDEATIRKLLAICETNDCKLYDARTGCTWGHDCKRYQQWVKRLAGGHCNPWGEL